MECPYCKEEIKAEATKCINCGQALNKWSKAKHWPRYIPKKYRNLWRFGWLVVWLNQFVRDPDSLLQNVLTVILLLPLSVITIYFGSKQLSKEHKVSMLTAVLTWIGGVLFVCGVFFGIIFYLVNA
ncbi:MAG: hypothetical protein CMM56_06785 [Rhodospirillaceae bacterium]|nr:hypothetical protein [Rhodospirillaceae bacterium]|tara:strand:- start:1 stop:378 length:378 start_codon:yes stop_codon:yes gene_type:complete